MGVYIIGASAYYGVCCWMNIYGVMENVLLGMHMLVGIIKHDCSRLLRLCVKGAVGLLSRGGAGGVPVL
jgi:hypothetical protein